MNDTPLIRDIKAAEILKSAISKAIAIFNETKIDVLADDEVTQRANAIHWSLLMFNNDVFKMLESWRKDLRTVSTQNNKEAETQSGEDAPLTGDNTPPTATPDGGIKRDCSTCGRKRYGTCDPSLCDTGYSGWIPA